MTFLSGRPGVAAMAVAAVLVAVALGQPAAPLSPSTFVLDGVVLPKLTKPARKGDLKLYRDSTDCNWGLASPAISEFTGRFDKIGRLY